MIIVVVVVVIVVVVVVVDIIVDDDDSLRRVLLLLRLLLRLWLQRLTVAASAQMTERGPDDARRAVEGLVRRSETARRCQRRLRAASVRRQAEQDELMRIDNIGRLVEHLLELAPDARVAASLLLAQKRLSGLRAAQRIEHARGAGQPREKLDVLRAARLAHQLLHARDRELDKEVGGDKLVAASVDKHRRSARRRVAGRHRHLQPDLSTRRRRTRADTNLKVDERLGNGARILCVARR